MLKAEGSVRNLTDEEAAVFEDWLDYESVIDQETKSWSWIPITKQLPEVGLRVITCSYTRKIRIAQLMRSGAWMPDGWHEPLIMPHEIAAWMSLPEAYKSEENGGTDDA